MSFRPMTYFSKKAVSSLIASLLIPQAAFAFSPFVIKDIQVTGLESTEPSMVFSYVPARVGSTFTEEQSTELIRRLYATGLFNDVKVNTSNNIVQINVVERPLITSITFEGMRAFDNKAITTALSNVGFGTGRALDPALLDRATSEIRQQYVAKGHYGVDVTSTLTPLPNNRVGISFTVDEGVTSRIKEINIVGNKAFSESDLLDELSLTTPGFMTWYTGTHKYSREKLEQDSETLKSYYLDRGYLDFTMEPPQVTISPNREDISINMTVTEGEPYTLRKVQLAGDLLDLNTELEALVTPKSGEVFSATKARDTVNAIKTRLGELGYAFATVTPNPVPNPETHEADLTFFVDPGKRVYVRRIDIGGNVRTRDQVIRREMRQQEAAWYDAGQLATSQERIDRLGYFNEVQVSQAPVSGTDDQVDIIVDVKEKPTGMINLGVGYGSTDKLSFTGGISQENIFGSGTDLGLQLNTSKRNRAAVITHTDPYWTSSGISRTTSLYYRIDRPYNSNVDQDEDNYRTRSIGLGMNFGVPISENDRIFMGLSFENNKIELPSESAGYIIPRAYRDFVDIYGESTNVLMFNLGWAKDTRDSAIAPTRGYLTSLNATLGVGDLKYYMLSAQQQYYLPLGKNYTLAFNLGADYGRSLDSNKPFPVIKNLYAGGIGSVRGYEGSSLGPRDLDSGDYLGGSSRIVANMQLYLPFPGTQNDRSLRWFLFADAGKVSVSGKNSCSAGNDRYGGLVEKPCGWRYSAGVGLSWQSPLGPLQISYARPISAKPGDNKESFQFQIGTAF
ncbi:MAG: outer membrane protein assembly factor BamA [Alcaligenaceae bacterium]|nr:outer membrane protein assembly factor BamA [Alcaligenaceae bacterium]